MSENSYEQRLVEYQAEDQRYWKQLAEELNKLREYLKASIVELADGLDISRQTLAVFLDAGKSKGSKKGLPIYKANLLQLWDYITDPKRIKEDKSLSNLSEEARLNREQFRSEGPKRLLMAAGFSVNNSQELLAVHPTKAYLIQNIEDRLFHSKFTDSELNTLVNIIEDEITLAKVSKQIEENYNLLKFDDSWLEDWQKKTIEHPQDEILEKFKRQINRYKSLGKTEFSKIELYELYMNILNNSRFFATLDRQIKMKVINCSFATLTFSIQDYLLEVKNDKSKEVKDIKEVKEKLLEYEKESNKILGQEIEFSPVRKALITCTFKRGEALSWQFSSSATHLQNLLSAVEQGMGYHSLIYLTDLSVKSLGRKSHSLVKITIGFGEDNNVIYRIQWIDHSILTGILQAVINTGTAWLNSKLNSKDMEDYRHVCKNMAKIKKELIDCENLLEKLVFKSVISKCEKLIEDINKLKEEYLKKELFVFSFYNKFLNEEYYKANLIIVDVALIRGNLKKASNFLSNLDYDNSKYIAINVSQIARKFFYRFLSGNEFFFSTKQWRTQLESIDNKLRNYMSTENIDNKNYDDCLDIYKYRSASEIYGSSGIIEFYLCTKESIDDLEKLAVKNFYLAAHYAAKIGQKQRTAHWLLMISRAYCRLKKREQAKALMETAKLILEETVEYKYDFLYQESIKTEIELTNGEFSLLILVDCEQALECFFKSLKAAIYLELALVIADNLYNIYRTIAKMIKDNKPLYINKITEKLKDFSKLEKELKEENQIVKEVVVFLNRLTNDLKSDENEQIEICLKNLKAQAKEIWKIWFEISDQDSINYRQHTIASMIDNNSFLDYIPE